MKLSTSIDIEAPVHAVWRCIEDPQLIVRWVEGALEHRYLDRRDPHHPSGQKFQQRIRQGRKVIVFEGTLIAFDEPRHLGFTIPTRAYSSEAHFRLTPAGAGQSHLDYSLEVTLHTARASLVAAVLRVPLGFFVRRQMQRLRALAVVIDGETP